MCVCVLDFLGDDADPSPFEKETPSRIYKSGRVGVIIMFFLIQDELLTDEKSCGSLFQNHIPGDSK